MDVRLFARRYGLDLLIVLAAIAGAIEVVLRNGAPGAPHVAPLLAAPAVALVALPLVGRRQFPFAAPITVWLLASAFSFLDARITRELHDIVAHAVSVMVLQVGAVRRRLPEAMAEDKKAGY